MDQVNIDFNGIEWQKWDKPEAIGRVKKVNGKRVRGWHGQLVARVAQQQEAVNGNSVFEFDSALI